MMKNQEYFKIFKESDKHHGFQYHDGVNIDDKFNEKPECGNGMFFTTREHVHDFYGYGNYIRRVIPLGNIVKVGSDKFKTNKLELKKKYWLGDLNTYKELNIPMIDMDLSSKYGFISILKWWKENVNEFVYSERAMNWASMNGYVDVLKWWKENVDELKYSQYSMDFASKYGHISVLNWWLKKSKLEIKYSKYSMDWASMNGHVDVLKWWKENVDKLKYSEFSMGWASKKGHIDVLNWWKENVNELKYSEISMDFASENGHVDVLNWWKESGLLEE
jgi:hypothetical protein